LFVAGTCWGVSIGATGWLAGPLALGADALVAALAGWFVGGLVGVISVAQYELRAPHAALGYLAGLTVVGLVTNPLAVVMAMSPGSAAVVLTTSPLYLFAPLFSAAAGLASSEPDALAAFGLRLIAETGKRRITWVFLAWTSLPALCVAAGLWMALHRPTDYLDRTYGEGSRACRRAADCRLHTNCNDCGRCYSVSPVRPYECQAVCQVARGTTCECMDGACVAVAPR
jgi:hypothetical protein